MLPELSNVHKTNIVHKMNITMRHTEEHMMTFTQQNITGTVPKKQDTLISFATAIVIITNTQESSELGYRMANPHLFQSC